MILNTKSPQLEDGFTRIANELFEAVIGFGFSQRQMAVLLAVLRKTYGYGKKEDDMSASQIGELCNMRRSHVTTTLGELAAMNAITKRPGVYGSIVGINKSFEQWGKAAKQSNVTTLPFVRTEKAHHYTYKVTCETTGEFYIGVRSCDCTPGQDRYLGSGNWSHSDKAALKKEIISTYTTRSEAEADEKVLIRKHVGIKGMRNITQYASSDSGHGSDSEQDVQNLTLPSSQSEQGASSDSGHTKENLSKENQQKKARARNSSPEVCFAEWIESVKAEGKKPIPEDHSVFGYAEEIGLPLEFVRLCWLEFKNTFADNEKKKYADWPKAFSNYVRKNYFRLWFEKDGTWQLTTAGIQLQKEMRAKP